MMNWRIELSDFDKDKGRAQKLPRPALTSDQDVRQGRVKLQADRYIASPELLAAVNTAIALGQPLLIAGEPGTGKTQLAYYVAARLGFQYEDEVLRFDVKSTTNHRDLLYQYDSLSHFHAANNRKTTPDAAEFIHFEGLGRAVFNAKTKAKATELMGKWAKHPGKPRRSVVLIDEIDKAPRDVPNDLLREIETMEFRIPELGADAIARGNRELRPIVIITSNAEQSLPDAFLRRCCFFHIGFPEPGALRNIVVSKLQTLPRDATLLTDVLDVFQALRDRRTRMAKPPATAELLGFVMALVSLGFGEGARLQGRTDWHETALSTLCKTTLDRDAGVAQLAREDLFKPPLRLS